MMTALRMLSFVLLCTSFICAQSKTADLTRTRELMNSWARAADCPAQLVVVVKSDGSVWTQAVGLADTKRKIPFGDWTRIPLGALTEDLFGVGLRLAAESHGLKFGDPVGGALGEADPVKHSVRALTWTKLHGRTTGLACYFAYTQDLKTLRPLDTVLTDNVLLRGRTTLKWPSRSHAGIAVLQRALERTVKKPWPIYLKEVVGKHIGLRGTVDASSLYSTGDLRIYNREGESLATGVWFSEVAAAYNAWTTAADIPAYLKNLMQELKDPESHRFDAWHKSSEPRWDVDYRYLMPIGIGAPCAVNLFPDHEVAMFWFSNRRDWSALRKLRHSVLEDLLGKPTSQGGEGIELGGGAGGRLVLPGNTMTERWRGKVYAGHPVSRELPLELKISSRRVVLGDGLGAVSKFKLKRRSEHVDGTIDLKDGGSLELSLDYVVGTLQGIGVWHDGDAFCLPRRVRFEVAPKGSEPYPGVGRK